MAVTDLAGCLDVGIRRRGDPVHLRRNKTFSGEFFLPSDYYLLSAGINTKYIQRMGMGESKPFPLSNGVSISSFVPSENIASTVHDIPGEPIFPACFFEETDIIVIRDKTYLLTLTLLRHPQAVTCGESADFPFGHPSQGEKGRTELFLTKCKKEI
jgi:hypothetical protein